MTHSSGIVYLVGAGPGDPGLITVGGLERLRAAQVVLYDPWIHPALLAEAPEALLVDVDKLSDHYPARQDEINQVLIEHAQAGRTVVRLKGGDPFVFGRGGEEAEALVGAGIPFQVVPGVSSAIAVPAYAGIPVTHRALACSFAVITGDCKADREDEIACDWRKAAGADTLVFLTDVTVLPTIVKGLIEVGRSRQTPAAVIERGSFGGQKTVTGTIETIERIVDENKVRSPATFVVGKVVSLREKVRWFDFIDREPLLGLRVLNTRAAEDAEELNQRLRELGAVPLSLPATRMSPPSDLAPLDAAVAAIASGSPAAPAFDWIGFTSAHAVPAFMARLIRTQTSSSNHPQPISKPQGVARTLDARSLSGIRLAAVGPPTAEALGRYGLVPDLVPDRAAGRHLAAALGDVAGQRILLPRSDVALRDLPSALRERGADVIEVVAYTTQPAPANQVVLDAVMRRELDAATFFSPSAVNGFAAQVSPVEPAEVLRGIAAICVGPTTAQAAKEKGLADVLIAEETSVAGVIRSLIGWRLGREGG